MRLVTCNLRLWTRRSLLPVQFLFLVSGLWSLVSLTGCGPKYTYPADQVPQSIEKLCLEENKLEVSARVVGKTAGAVYYVDNLVDATGQIPKEVHEKMGQIMQSVTRVGLSTDLPLDYCMVVIRDRMNSNELTITKALDDIKRANSDAIGVEESMNRTLFGQSKYKATPGGDPPFILKEVKPEAFIAEQVAQRIRFGIAKETKPKSNNKEEEENKDQSLILVDGVFNPTAEGKKFRFSILSLKAEDPQQTMLLVFRTVSEVLKIYRFEDYDAVEILDYLNRQKLEVPKEAVAEFQNKKLPEQAILDRYLTETQSMQEAFKLFGFNITDAASDSDAALPIAPATP